jgi:hypothetical protein
MRRSPKHKLHKMASTTFTQAIDALVRERDRVFIERVAGDYGLDLAELKAKYFESSEAAIKIPKQYKKREPKSVKVATDKVMCTAVTAKKEVCKFGAIDGCFCKRHAKVAADPKPAKPEKVKKAKKEKVVRVESAHNHAEDGTTHADCQHCQHYGNPLPPFPVTTDVTQTIEERLASIMGNADAPEPVAEADTESEADTEAESESDLPMLPPDGYLSEGEVSESE